MLDFVQRVAGYIRDFLCLILRVFYGACHFCCYILRFVHAIVYFKVEIEEVKKGGIARSLAQRVYSMTIACENRQ